jgi:hypothetical protein
MRLTPQAIREHSLQFDGAIFKSKMADFIRFALKDFAERNQGLNFRSGSLAMAEQNQDTAAQ